MYILNPEIIKNTFKCKKHLANYLMYNCGISLLSCDEKFYYFVNSDELKNFVKNAPFWTKVGNLVF